MQRRESDDEETIQKRLEIAQRELEQAKAEGFHDRIFVNDDLETTYKKLENYIFGIEQNSEEPSQLPPDNEKEKSTEVRSTEVDMVDNEVPTAVNSSNIDSSGGDDSKASATTAESVAAGGETS